MFYLQREEVKEKESSDKKQKLKRYAWIGLATVGGGTLIGEHRTSVSLYNTTTARNTGTCTSIYHRSTGF